MEASAAPRPAAPRRAGLVSPRLLRVASDDKLVRLVRQGSQPAFEVLYDRHHRGILSFCRHMLGTREEAEDALQHTFMAAYRDMVASDKEIQLRAWLYAIARNRCLTVLRSRRDKPADELEDIPTEGLASEVQRRQDLQDLLHDLAALPPDQREALVLSEIGDLPHHEIAAVIGCPTEKVKALVFQARTSLHSSRDARETSCADIREMLSSLRGGSLRRTPLRRHLRECPGCREFQAEVRRQRQAMAVLLPVVPSIGLKDSALAAAFSSHGAAVAGTAATVGAGAAAVAGSGAAAGGGGAALAAKTLVVALALGGGAAGVKSATSDDAPVKTPVRSVAGTPSTPTPSPTPGSRIPIVPAVTEKGTSDEATKERTRSGHARRRGHTDRGKEFAKTRGKGKKRGLLGTQPGKQDKTPPTTGGQSVERKQAASEKRAAVRRKRSTKAKQRRAVRRARQAPVRRIQKQTKTQPAPDAEAKPKPSPTPDSTPESEPVPDIDPLDDDARGKPKRQD
jgi:RNA polymerase sigma factor (sigma-70 family)